MIPPFSIVLIKPMTVGRGQAPLVLCDILHHCPVVLRKFREWTLCDTTIQALGNTAPDLIFPPGRKTNSWICLFTHIDRTTDPTDMLHDLFGHPSFFLWVAGQLRHKYGGFSNFGTMAHPSDDVVHISDPSRAELEAKILFHDFDGATV